MLPIRRSTFGTALALAAMALAGAATPAHGQFGKRLKNAVKRTAEDRAIQEAVKTENQAIDGAMSGAQGATPDTTAASAAPAPTAATAAPTAASTAPVAGAADTLKPGQGAWANYDFKPGERVLFADDFAGDQVGDFPRRMEFKTGSLEIVEWQGTRFLRANSDSRWFVGVPETLPQRFTMEFDYAIPTGGEVWISFADENKRIQLGGDGTAVVYNNANGVRADGRLPHAKRGDLYRARVLVDGGYMKVYLDDTRLLNVPNAELGRGTRIAFYTDGDATQPSLFGNFRIAAGGRKLYDAIAQQGRVATQGIYFDTGSDRIRPESTPTLKEIGAMLTEHAELKLTIEGHTDDVGQASANQALSEKRAAAVREYLIATYQVDGSRLSAKGLGQSKPAASNATPEGRQQNRRVELVKS
ncbi:MAG TPA: OmpA family protein [Gemmatimonadales bacterium]|nr:OmpA family protein [Gemmatimonadales bacterium]